MLVRFYINCDDLPPKAVFKYLLGHREKIEAAMDMFLIWNELPDKKGCVIAAVRPESDVDDEAAWPVLHAWLESNVARMDKVFRPLIVSLGAADLT